MPPRVTRRSARHVPPLDQIALSTDAAVDGLDTENSFALKDGQSKSVGSQAVPRSSLSTADPVVDNSADSLAATRTDSNTNMTATTSEQTDASSTSVSRRPVQRLSSLRGSAAAAASNSTSGSRSAGLKFQPKSVVRRSREDREAQERLEEERRIERARANVATDGSASRRGRGGFRGGMSGWKTERRGGGASGFLGGKTVAESSGQRGGGGRRGGRGEVAERNAKDVGGTGVVKRETASAMDLDDKHEKSSTAKSNKSSKRKKGDPKIKSEDKVPVHITTDDEDDEGPRINIENINLVSDEESADEAQAASTTAQGKQRARSVKTPGWALKPIRLDRQEHIDRSAGINTDLTLTSAQLRQKAKEKTEAEGTLFVSEDEAESTKTKPKRQVKKGKDVEFVRDGRRWQGVYQDEDDHAQDTTAIKKETTDDDEAMVLDAPEATSGIAHEDTTMRDSTLSEQATNVLEGGAAGDELPVPARPKRRRKPLFRPTKPVLQTKEDREEWARYEDDIHALGEELGNMSTVTISSLQGAVDADGDLAMAGEGEENAGDGDEKDRRQGLVYLFQMPPVLPSLISAEPAAETAADVDTMMDANVDAAAMPPPPLPPLQSSSTPSSTPKTAKKSQPTIKIEDDPSQREYVPNAVMAEDKAKFEGQVGTLRVYGSGAIGLGWGGTEFELAKGGEGELLREVVVAEVGEQGKPERTGGSMGQVTGGFVVMPYWEGLFEG